MEVNKHPSCNFAISFECAYGDDNKDEMFYYPGEDCLEEFVAY